MTLAEHCTPPKGAAAVVGGDSAWGWARIGAAAALLLLAGCTWRIELVRPEPQGEVMDIAARKAINAWRHCMTPEQLSCVDTDALKGE